MFFKEVFFSKALNGLVRFDGISSICAGCVRRQLQPMAGGSTALRTMQHIQGSKARVPVAFHGSTTPPMDWYDDNFNKWQAEARRCVQCNTYKGVKRVYLALFTEVHHHQW